MEEEEYQDKSLYEEDHKVKVSYQTENMDDCKAAMEIIISMFPYRDNFGRDFKENVDNVQALCEQSMEHLEQSRDTDPDHFWLDMSRSNYLTMLYLNCDPPKLEEARKQNQETLSRDPRSFNALWNRWELYRLEGNRQEEESETVLEMEEILNDSVQMCTAKAELGVYYPDFGPIFYEKAVNLLEETFAEMAEQEDHFPSGFSSSPSCIKWKFHLARTYSKLMNKGTAVEFWKANAASNEFFKYIKVLLNDVIQSKDPFYSAKAWIELADAYQKYTTEASSPTESLPLKMTVEDCYDKALDMAPDDFFVLERSGRYYRQQGGQLKRAIELLEKSTQLNPLRDVAFHHLGLAYRAMWIIEEEHDEAKLYQPKPDGGRGNHTRTGSASRGRGDGGGGRGGRGGGRGGRGGNGNRGGEGGRGGGRGSRGGAANSGLQGPGYFDMLKTNNPTSKNQENRYLQKATECMEKACELTKGRHPRYLIDHARLLISGNQMDNALVLLKQAEKTQFNSIDGAYLYEQLGMLEESMSPQRVQRYCDGVFKDAMMYYRKSILHAWKGKDKSRVAIYKLKDLLPVAKQNIADTVLEKEHHLISDAMQNATSRTAILTELTKDTGRLKELVELFDSEDKESAAIYDELLKSATEFE